VGKGFREGQGRQNGGDSPNIQALSVVLDERGKGYRKGRENLWLKENWWARGGDSFRRGAAKGELPPGYM